MVIRVTIRAMAQWVDIDQLTLSAARPARPLPAVSARLVELVRRHGPLEPVLVRPLGPGRYEILANVQTWLAAQRAGQGQVPVEVLDDLDGDEALEVLAAYGTGRDPDPVDEALEFERQLEEFGGANQRGALARLARFLDMDRSYISHSLRLLTLPPQVQLWLREGKLSASHGKVLATVHPPARCRRLALRVINQRLSVRATESLLREEEPDTDRVPPMTRAVPEQRDPDLIRLEQKLSEHLGSRVHLDTQAGHLIVDYAGDLDVLQGVFERFGFDPSL